MFLPARLWNLRSEDFLRAFEGPTQPFPYWRSGKTASIFCFQRGVRTEQCAAGICAGFIVPWVFATLPFFAYLGLIQTILRSRTELFIWGGLFLWVCPSLRQLRGTIPVETPLHSCWAWERWDFHGGKSCRRNSLFTHDAEWGEGSIMWPHFWQWPHFWLCYPDCDLVSDWINAIHISPRDWFSLGFLPSLTCINMRMQFIL